MGLLMLMLLILIQLPMQKNKKIKSVVNKTNQIDNTYRNFQMEVLAGDINMVTKLVSKSS